MGNNETILLVEDDQQFRETAKQLLEDSGYHVLAAGNGPDALHILHDGVDIDLLFTDMIMPGGLNGHELALKCTALRPGLPVLLASGYPRDAFNESRKFSLLSKPYTQDTLLHAIQGVMGNGEFK